MVKNKTFLNFARPIIKKSKPQIMKQISTLVKNFTLLVLILILTFNTQAQQQTGQNGESIGLNVSFIGVPTLISGTALSIGAKYRFLNVANKINADVTIVSATGGATVTNIDDNTSTKPEAFSPIVLIPANSIGMVEFNIEYFKADNSGGNGGSKDLKDLSVTAYDIDGFTSGTASIKEIDMLDLGAGGTVSFLSNALQINVIQNGSQFTATNIAGINYDGTDTSAKQVMFTVTNQKVSSFTYKAGANNGFSFAYPRQFAIYFKAFDYIAAALLPVKYQSFTGNAVNKSVVLNWVTAQEANNNYFEIERSFTGKDFTSIGIAMDGFENGTKKEYAFKDNSPLLEDREIVYYRLKQFDNDGKYSYSSILVVRLKSISKLDIQVSPNPFTERLTVRFTGTQNTTADVSLTNMSGQAVINKKMSTSKGYNNIQVEGLSSLPSGTYLATVIINGQVVGSQKIVK